MEEIGKPKKLRTQACSEVAVLSLSVIHGFLLRRVQDLHGRGWDMHHGIEGLALEETLRL